MRKRSLNIVIILALLTGLLTSATVAGAAPPPPDYKPVDVGPELRNWEATPGRIKNSFDGFTAEQLDKATASALESADDELLSCVLDVKYWLSLDDYNGYYFLTPFYLVAQDDKAQIWVQVEEAYDSLGEPIGRAWQDGDPRETPVITCDQVQHLLGEYSNNINTVESAFFGPADPHDGSFGWLDTYFGLPDGYWSDTAGRQVVLVSNIRDDNYYDPNYPNYIAGFYSPSFEGYFDRNIMSIDAYDWANRVGPDGSRPYLYESVFAHEYQHLLHDDYDSDEDTWLNEGLSMFSEHLTGYVVNEDPYSTFQELPENSLTAWGDQGGREIVSDYGIVFLYQMFLYEKFGQEFIQAEFQNPLNGITSVEDVLDSKVEWNETSFADTYHDFSVAVLIDSDENNYQYGFDFGDVAIELGSPGNPNLDAFDTPGAPPWGADYITLPGQRSIHNFVFNGYQFNPTAWTSDGDVLYSGDGDLIDNIAIFEATGGGTLTFDTYWDIEDDWDFGFVQVSTDGGHNWTSLSNAYTTDYIDPDGHPNIADELPGLTSWSCFVEDDCWVNMSFDLSGYPGDILLAFRYMTDWAFTYEGWYIDNVYVDDTLISDGSSTEPFMSFNELFEEPENAFTVIFVGERNRKGESEYEVVTVLSGDGYEVAWDQLREMFKNYRSVVMIVSSNPEEGVTDYAPYDYQLMTGGDKPFKNKPPR